MLVKLEKFGIIKTYRFSVSLPGCLSRTLDTSHINFPIGEKVTSELFPESGLAWRWWCCGHYRITPARDSFKARSGECIQQVLRKINDHAQ